MTDEIQPKTAIIAGHVIGVIAPTQGQFEALLRLRKTLARGSDDSTQEFYATQVDRLGTLLESLIVEGDRDTVDQLVLTGKTDLNELMTKMFAALKTEEAEPVKPVKKAVRARAR